MKVEIYNVVHVIIFGFIISKEKNNEVLELKQEIVSKDIENKSQKIKKNKIEYKQQTKKK